MRGSTDGAKEDRRVSLVGKEMSVAQARQLQRKPLELLREISNINERSLVLRQY